MKRKKEGIKTPKLITVDGQDVYCYKDSTNTEKSYLIIRELALRKPKDVLKLMGYLGQALSWLVYEESIRES